MNVIWLIVCIYIYNVYNLIWMSYDSLYIYIYILIFYLFYETKPRYSMICLQSIYIDALYIDTSFIYACKLRDNLLSLVTLWLDNICIVFYIAFIYIDNGRSEGSINRWWGHHDEYHRWWWWTNRGWWWWELVLVGRLRGNHGGILPAA